MLCPLCTHTPPYGQGSWMAPDDHCRCGWQSTKGGASTRALTAHMKVCPLRAPKATSNRPKRGAMEIDMGDPGDGLAPTEPAQKTPRRLVCQPTRRQM